MASRESYRRGDAPSTTLCIVAIYLRASVALGSGQGFVQEVRCTRSSRSGTRIVRPRRRLSSEEEEEEEEGEWCQQTLRQACSQAYPGSARCVQSFDDSLDSASRKTYRISLRSSSLWEPRHPSLKVLQRCYRLREGGSGGSGSGASSPFEFRLTVSLGVVLGSRRFGSSFFFFFSSLRACVRTVSEEGKKARRGVVSLSRPTSDNGD